MCQETDRLERQNELELIENKAAKKWNEWYEIEKF